MKEGPVYTETDYGWGQHCIILLYYVFILCFIFPAELGSFHWLSRVLKNDLYAPVYYLSLPLDYKSHDSKFPVA